MSVEEKQTEALKALAEWSKWIVTLETTLLTALIAIASFSHSNLHDANYKWIVVLSMASFFISILAAGSLMGAIPDALQNVPIKYENNDNIYGFKHYDDVKCMPSIPIKIYALSQHCFAIIGLCLLIIFSAIHMFG